MRAEASLEVSVDDPVLQKALHEYHGRGITSDKKISDMLLKQYDIRMGYVTFCLPISGSNYDWQEDGGP